MFIYCKTTVLYKLINRFNAISIKIPVRPSVDIDRIILKCIWSKGNEIKIAKKF